MTTYKLEIDKAKRRIKAMEDKVSYYENKKLEALKTTQDKRKIMKQTKLLFAEPKAPKKRTQRIVRELRERKEELKLFEDIGDQTIIAIDLLEGLTENQKSAVNGLVKMGATPMGITIYTDTGDIYYFGKKVGNVK